MNIQEIASASALLKQELAPLAEKIGQGVEWTFQLFVKQAYVEAFTGLLWCVFGAVVIYFASWLFKRVDGVNDNEGRLFLRIASAFLLLVGISLILLPIASLIQVLINPEYAAIQIILKTIKQN